MTHDALAREEARHAALVPPGLVAWIRAHGLEAAWTPVLHTTAAWIASAAPPWATPAQRALACMDLGTCFFLLDDADDARAPALYDDLDRMTTGAVPAADRPLQAAFADLFARLAALGSIDHYLAARREFAHALRRRHAVRTGAATLDLEGHVALRTITIYVEPWLSLWEVLGGFVLSPDQRALVAPALTPAIRWQALENDRVSVARDAREGTPNAAALLAARGLSPAAAAAEVTALADEALAAYRTADAALAAASVATSVRRFLATLADSVDGAVRHYRRADPARYASPPAGVA